MHPWLFYVAVAGAAFTAFYMFRLWYLTFAGEPRDAHVAEHAHESPPSMVVPLVILAALSIAAAWNVPFTRLGLEPLLDQARPAGISAGTQGGLLLPHVVQPPEYLIQVHTAEIPVKATLLAFVMALLGFLLATFFYGLRKLDPADARRQFAAVHQFLLHKWWFDELYDRLFVRPLLRVCRWVADFDKRVIDWLADNAARAVAAVSRLDDWIDRVFVDAAVNLLARWTHAFGLRLRAVQTGSLHQYVVFIAVGTVTLFVLMSLYWKYAIAGM
jgi:NADH-quinone oxidoreductase subunit L